MRTETRRQYRGKSGLFRIALPWVSILLAAAGCGGGANGESLALLFQEPAPGQVVQSHSVSFSVVWDGAVDASALALFLNGEDVSGHLRIEGTRAEGNVPLSRQGDNVLGVAASAADGRAGAAEVRFSFAPIPIEAVTEKESMALAGLDGPVEVLVDPWGVHHIYAMGANPDDVAFVQGFLTAKHRLFQLDFFRKVAQGRLAELMGISLDKSVLEIDLFYRTMFLTYERGKVEPIYNVLEDVIAEEHPEEFHQLERFTAGVSAYMEEVNNGKAPWPQQYRLLNLLGRYDLEPMTVSQVLAIGRVQQWDLSQTLDEEINRKLNSDGIGNAEEKGIIPTGSLADMIRSAPPDHTTVLQPGEPFYVGPVAAGAEARPSTPGEAFSSFPSSNRDSLQRIRDRIRRVRALLRGNAERPFSNNWILAPSMTDAGFALLANDPHLSLDNPAIFYPVHGDNKTFSTGGLNYSGCTFPGVPGLMLGQNENLAWGGTVTCYDVTDVYEEKVTVVGDEKWVEYYGEQVPVETSTERFSIRGGDPVDIAVDYVPHHGCQMPGDPYSPDPGLTPENNLTVQWTGHYTTMEVEAFFGLLAAEDMDAFFASLSNFGVGAQNFVGADTNGEIGYDPHALLPIRKPAALTHANPPYMPLPGTGGFEWEADEQGRPVFLASDQVPHLRNPDRGWLATANNDIVGQTIDNDALNDPFYYAYQFSVGYRSGRVTELILEGDRSGRTPERMQELQGDHLSRIAEQVRPYFLAATSNAKAIAEYGRGYLKQIVEARGRVAKWDLRCRAGLADPLNEEDPSPEDIESSIATAIFSVWMNRMIEFALADELGASGASLGSEDLSRTIIHILADVGYPPDSPYYVHTLGPDGQSLLWNDINTRKKETRDDIMVKALVQAFDDLRDLAGSKRMDQWRWGKFHRQTFRLEGLGDAILAYNLPSYSLMQQLLGDTLGYPRNGGWETVDPAGYSLDGMRDTQFNPSSGPAMRMVVELEPGVMSAYNVIPGGVNDLQPDANLRRPVEIDPATHYGDQLSLWLAHRYRPQLIFYEDVTRVAQYRLSFEPE